VAGAFATVTTRADAWAWGGTRRHRLRAPDDMGGTQLGEAQNALRTVLRAPDTRTLDRRCRWRKRHEMVPASFVAARRSQCVPKGNAQGRTHARTWCGIIKP